MITLFCHSEPEGRLEVRRAHADGVYCSTAVGVCRDPCWPIVVASLSMDGHCAYVVAVRRLVAGEDLETYR